MSDGQKTGPQKFDWEGFLLLYKKQIVLSLVGLILVGAGVLAFKGARTDNFSGVEVLESSSESLDGTYDLVVEVSGSVETPGVYKLSQNSRVEDALIAAGGLSASADRELIEKTLNRAAKVVDGQKIYIPSVNEQSGVLSANIGGGDQTITGGFSSSGEGSVNINTATLKELDSLPGIGPVYGQSIVDHRPYSTTEELVSKGAIRQSTYEKLKSLVSVY